MQKLTPLKAIQAKCFDCGYDSYDTGTKHEQIESCRDTGCPLHEYRPITNKTKERIRQERISNFTPEELEAYKRKGAAFKLNVMSKNSRIKSR